MSTWIKTDTGILINPELVSCVFNVRDTSNLPKNHLSFRLSDGSRIDQVRSVQCVHHITALTNMIGKLDDNT